MRSKPSIRLTVTNFEQALDIWNYNDVVIFFMEKSMKWIPSAKTAVEVSTVREPEVRKHVRGSLSRAVEMRELLNFLRSLTCKRY